MINQKNPPVSPASKSDEEITDDQALRGIQLITVFIDDLFEKAGLSKLMEEDKQLYRVKMLELIEQRLFTVSLSHLEGEDLARLHEMTKDKQVMDAQKITIFLSQKVKDFPKVLDEAMQAFEKDFLQGADKINKAVDEAVKKSEK